MQKLQAIRLQEVRMASWHDHDPWLVIVILFLLTAGLVMVASSSIALAERLHDDPFYYFRRQVFSLALGLALGAFILKSPVVLWEKMSLPLLLLAIALLALVLIPGVGREVNGSVRWIRLGPVNFQGSELAKVCMIAYVAAYLVRNASRLHMTFTGFIRPIGVVTLISALLLLEPDYGSVVVIFLTTVGMLFLAGIPASRFLVWIPVMVAALGALAAVQPRAVVQLANSHVLEDAGTLIRATGHATAGAIALRVSARLESGELLQREIADGDVWRLPLAAKARADVRIQARRGVSVGGKRRLRLQLTGGRSGLLFDARLNTLEKESSMTARAVKMLRWFAAVSGDDEPVVIPESWLARQGE